MQALKHIFMALKNGWMKFAHAVGWFNTRLLLTLVYFTIIALPAMFLKVFRKDLLDRRPDRNVQSYWKTKSPVVHSVDSAKHQF